MRVIITDHAVTRYVERVKPHVSPVTAREELRRLCEAVELPEGQDERVTISEGIEIFGSFVSPDRWFVATVLTRSGYGEQLRAQRNAKKAARRRKRREKLYRAGQRARKERW